jgi:DNA invertase Pin-like site-specific DNA recombinase
MPELSIPVAEYLRMSSEHQQYSLDNQHAKIQSYSDAGGFSIVKTYTDGARSGVVLKRRHGLRQLLKDVVDKPSYKAILVYDVSRWGRFQDADESAHYEFLCKSAGVPVHYCAEAFVNDGSLPNTLMKALKRTMAGEYSRELGVKVLDGLKRLARLGFKQGGCPGYGLRRMLLSSEGELKQQLRRGERKSIATERVILVPGPEEELQIVREIYRMFVDDGCTVYAIARELNRQAVPYGSSQWSHHVVHQILSHPKYAGCNVFGRTSQKLGTPSVCVPESEWIRAPRAFAPIILEATFQEARRLLLGRTVNKSNEELLNALRSLLTTEGRLSLALIKRSPGMPSPSTYRKRFGSLRRAYELIDYGQSSDFGSVDLRRRTQAMRESVLCEIKNLFPDDAKIIHKGGRWRKVLRLNGRIVSLLIVRSIGGSVPIWQIDPIRHERRFLTLVLFLNPANDKISEMRLFHRMERTRRFHVRKGDAWMNSGTAVINMSRLCSEAKALRQNPPQRAPRLPPRDL